MTKEKMYLEAEAKADNAMEIQKRYAEDFVNQIAKVKENMAKHDIAGMHDLYEMCKEFVTVYEREEEHFQAAFNVEYALSHIDE